MRWVAATKARRARFSETRAAGRSPELAGNARPTETGSGQFWCDMRRLRLVMRAQLVRRAGEQSAHEPSRRQGAVRTTLASPSLPCCRSASTKADAASRTGSCFGLASE